MSDKQDNQLWKLKVLPAITFADIKWTSKTLSSTSKQGVPANFAHNLWQLVQLTCKQDMFTALPMLWTKIAKFGK